MLFRSRVPPVEVTAIDRGINLLHADGTLEYYLYVLAFKFLQFRVWHNV